MHSRVHAAQRWWCFQVTVLYLILGVPFFNREYVPLASSGNDNMIEVTSRYMIHADNAQRGDHDQ